MKELVTRGLFGDAEAHLDVFPVLKIQGARQVGKSTLAKLLVEGRESVYKSLDREQFREQAEEDADFFVESPREATVVVDEIQRVPKVSLAVKNAVDEDRRPGRFILTGSSDFARVRGHKDSLAGRAVGIKVYPLSLAERVGTLGAGTFIDRVCTGRIGPGVRPSQTCTRDEMAELVEVGGYPVVQSLKGKQRRAWFKAYIEDVVGIDVVDQGHTPYPGRLQAVLRMLAAQQAQELVKATLARETSIPETSITGYIDVLQRIYLVELLRPWSRNLVSREKAKPKILVNDSGLAAYLTGRTRKQWLDPQESASGFGHVVEAALVQELLAQRGWAETDYEVYHWRDRTGKEVDIVVECADGSVIAFEVKTGAPRAKHFETLKLFRQLLGDKFLAGFVLADAAEVSPWSPKLFSAPWSILWS
ncbi:ATP-binding protein [Corynebacterium lizhenjunii]|uniref:ATP-binding protein n=1 Tax=Corynebacterium lizhenjunii TaxID=2709394 RepID=UPI0013EBCFAC|nr:ATP-binding protein [Corynebacterium lizhenjunii]